LNTGNIAGLNKVLMSIGYEEKPTAMPWDPLSNPRQSRGLGVRSSCVL